MNSLWVSMVSAVGLLTVLYGCAETSTCMIQANDQHYIQGAQELKEKAEHWEHTAEYYETHLNRITRLSPNSMPRMVGRSFKTT